jgi:trehalose-phosphatase
MHETPALTGRDALRLVAPRLAQRPLLVVSDFDGTLAGLVQDPWAASIVPGARPALRRLAATPGVEVAILSGRTVADVAARVRVGGATYLGDHGMQQARLRRGGRAETIEVRWVDILGHDAALAERIADGVARDVPEPWLVVERKLPAVTFHFRAAPDVEDAAQRVAASIERLDPAGEMVRFPGRRAYEVRPPGAPTKAEAMRSLLEERRPAVALMLGDDRHDARAFAVLQEARSDGLADTLAVAVASHADMLPEILPHADLLLASARESGRFLAGLARLVAAPIHARAHP